MFLLDGTFLWQIFSGGLAVALLVNLLGHHKERIKGWRKRQVKKAMQHNGIVGYQEKIEGLAKDNAELAKAPHDVSGISVQMGQCNGERVEMEEKVCLGMGIFDPMLDNVVSIESTKGCIAGKYIEYGLEDYLMGKPTQNELSKAIQAAAALRESGTDDKHLGKCLLNLNYRNKLLEKVLEHAELYVHGGSDPHEHTLLLKAIQDVQAAGQVVKHDTDGLDGTFMIS